MKKLSFIIGIIIFFFSVPNILAIEEEKSLCSIENNTSESITDYIKNLRKAVRNVNKELMNNISDNSKLNNTGNDITRMYNQVINWDGYFTDFDYYLIFPLFNNIPQPINRDFRLLENETQGLEKYLKTIVKRGYADISISKEKVCNGVKNCELEGTTMSIVGEMLKNQIRITNLYKRTIINPTDKQSANIILTLEKPNKFIEELQKNYGNKTIEICGNKEGEFGARIDNSINKITKNFNEGVDGIKKWEEAWALLVGAVNGKTDEDLEVKLLRKELNRQGVPSNMADTLVENLKEFNNNNYQNINNNFITSSWEQIKDAGIDIKKAYNSATNKLFGNKNNNAENNKKAVVGIDTFLSETAKNQKTNDIIKRLEGVYNTQNSFAAIDSYATSKVILNIIKMRGNISKSAEILKKAAKDASIVCNSQGTGQGKCNY